MSDQILAALVAAFVSSFVSLSVALAQLRQGKNSLRSQVMQDISSKYDRMLDYRLQRPEVLALAKKWDKKSFTSIYTQEFEDDKKWVIYYGYVELCISYCNAVLHAIDKKYLDADIFKSEHESLVRLLVTEHYPILSQIIRPGGYVSKYLVQYIASLKDEGWDWESEYKELTI